MSSLRGTLLKISCTGFIISLIGFIFFLLLCAANNVSDEEVKEFLANQYAIHSENWFDTLYTIEHNYHAISTKITLEKAERARLKLAEELAKNPPLILPSPSEPILSIYESNVFLPTTATNPLVYYNQTEEPWRDALYGPNNPIGKYGCGPTSLSMVLSTLLEENYTPLYMANWAYENGYFANYSGSYHSLIPEGAEAFGLVSTSLYYPSKEDIYQELSKGNLIIVLLGRGTLTQAGHFVVLRDFTEEGEILLGDSQSLDFSTQPWDINIILDEAKYYANSGGPFWSISKPD